MLKDWEFSRKKKVVGISGSTVVSQYSAAIQHKFWDAVGRSFLQQRRLFSFNGLDARGGGYSPKFRIGVCRERFQTLTLSKDKENEN